MHDGQTPRPLHENATRKPWPQRPHHSPGKPETEQSAGQVPAELRLNMTADWLAVRIVLGQPTLEVLGDDCIERNLLWSATDIPLPRCLTPPDRWQPLVCRLLAGRNHGAARLSEVPPLSKASAALAEGNEQENRPGRLPPLNSRPPPISRFVAFP